MQSETAESSVHLIEATARGDRAAFERLYDQFVGLVYTLGLRILGVRTDAEDLVQEVFLQAWRRAESYRPERGSPESWLMTIARNMAVDRLRAAHTVRKSLDALQSERARRFEDAPVTRVALLEEGDDVRAALRQLSDEQRKVLELSYFDGLTQSEIARHLGEPLGTIKTRVRLGLEKLRRLLAVRGSLEVAE
jgi:RNA polymerase sigma-70 factor (ECF subfamily)